MTDIHGRPGGRIIRNWRVWVALAAVVFLIVPVPGPLVDRWFGHGLYPAVQSVLTRLSNLVPVALLDLGLLAVLAWTFGGIVRLARGQAGHRREIVTRGTRRAVVAASVLYLVFMLTWGLNYRREALTSRLDFNAGRITPQSVSQLAHDTAQDLNQQWPSTRLPKAAEAPAWNQLLGPGFSQAQAALGLAGKAVPGRPKWSVLDPYFTRSGVSGMTDPFFLETLVASNLLPCERPAIIAHEWGHLAGLARESEASFFGWLVCLRSGPAVRYSGQLEIFLRTLAALDPADRRAVLASVRTEVREDIRAIAERNQRDQVRTVSRTAWRVYDRFLRANRVPSGIRDYDDVVALVLGTRFAADGVPGLRTPVR